MMFADRLDAAARLSEALQAWRGRNPLVLAIPRGALLVRPLADEVVCLYAPDDFYAVGQFYRTFGQVEDDEAIRLLAGGTASRPLP